jgi:hypothetical protein
MDMVKLQESVVRSLIEKIPPGWDLIKIYYERYKFNEIKHEVYTAESYHDGNKKEFTLSIKVLDAIAELNENPLEGQEEPWTSVDIEIDGNGLYKFDYKCGVPPLLSKRFEQARAYEEKKSRKT